MAMCAVSDLASFRLFQVVQGNRERERERERSEEQGNVEARSEERCVSGYFFEMIFDFFFFFFKALLVYLQKRQDICPI